tara:strand:- start:79 stop:351 length:273 start_codon:yes stop_codon:yes gene_type:complete
MRNRQYERALVANAHTSCQQIRRARSNYRIGKAIQLEEMEKTLGDAEKVMTLMAQQIESMSNQLQQGENEVRRLFRAGNVKLEVARNAPR